MRQLTIHKRVSRTSNWTSLYLTVNFIPLLREFNQSVNLVEMVHFQTKY